MDVLITDVADLDGPLLASLWVRAVLAADPAMVAACEIECERRGITAGALVAATKKKADGDQIQTVGDRKAGPHDYQDIITQAQKNEAAGKSWQTGQATYQTKGYNPYRKKKGQPGGGQFTSKGGAQETTDPETARKGAALQEDDPRIPKKSPGGADISDFRDGMMIYEDGTRFDGKGWRNAKGQALDAKGNVIKKGAKGKGKAGRSAAQTAADKKRAAELKAHEDLFKIAEDERKAVDKAQRTGDYGPLERWAENMVTGWRHNVEFAGDPAKKADAQKGLAEAEQRLTQVRADSDAAKKAKQAAQAADSAAKQTAAKAKATSDAAARQADQAAKTQAAQKAVEAAQQARYAAIAANYPAWEKELRGKYAGVGLSETELADLIIRDRARRVALLPRH